MRVMRLATCNSNSRPLCTNASAIDEFLTHEQPPLWRLRNNCAWRDEPFSSGVGTLLPSQHAPRACPLVGVNRPYRRRWRRARAKRADENRLAGRYRGDDRRLPVRSGIRPFTDAPIPAKSSSAQPVNLLFDQLPSCTKRSSPFTRSGTTTSRPLLLGTTQKSAGPLKSVASFCIPSFLFHWNNDPLAQSVASRSPSFIW